MGGGGLLRSSLWQSLCEGNLLLLYRQRIKMHCSLQLLCDSISWLYRQSQLPTILQSLGTPELSGTSIPYGLVLLLTRFHAKNRKSTKKLKTLSVSRQILYYGLVKNLNLTAKFV